MTKENLVQPSIKPWEMAICVALAAIVAIMAITLYAAGLVWLPLLFS